MPQATLPLLTSDMTIINFHAGLQNAMGKYIISVARELDS